MINKILVGTDGSDHAAKALKYAGELAAQCGAEVAVAAVDVPGPVPDELQDFAASEDLSHREVYEAIVGGGETAVKEAGAGKVSTHILSGDPAVALVDAAVDMNADLIVLGSRGHGAISGILLGSVSRKVLHMAKRPSLIVP